MPNHSSTLNGHKASPELIRQGILGFMIFGTFAIGVRHLFPGKAASGGAFDAFCPFGAIETMWVYITRGQTLATTSLLNFAVLGGVLAVSLFAGRAFCGWMCPLGGLQEWLASWSRRWSIKKPGDCRKSARNNYPLELPNRADAFLRNAKYLLLGSIVLASVSAVYPPLQSFCPLRAVFAFKLNSGLMWSVLLVFVSTSFLVERIWCKYLCPMGAVLAIFNKISLIRLTAEEEKCTHCIRCEKVCGMSIKNIPANLRHPECIYCLKCVEACQKAGSLELTIG